MGSVIRRLNWGCGKSGEPGWLNSDIKEGRGIDVSCDIRDGLAFASDSFDYIVSIHALPEIPYPQVVPTLQELRRVLRPGAVLRLALPDLDRAIEAYLRQDRSAFLIPDDEVASLGGKLIVQLIWYGYCRTLFTSDFIEELLWKSGFSKVERCSYKQTMSTHSGIVELDNRESESLFIEATK